MKSLFWAFFWLLLESNGHADDKICHQKPSGECERCCLISNDVTFVSAVTDACNTVPPKGASQTAWLNVKTQDFRNEIASSKSDSFLKVEYFVEFVQACPKRIEQPEAAPSSKYSDCAKGCRVPKAKGIK